MQCEKYNTHPNKNTKIGEYQIYTTESRYNSVAMQASIIIVCLIDLAGVL